MPEKEPFLVPPRTFSHRFFWTFYSLENPNKEPYQKYSSWNNLNDVLKCFLWEILHAPWAGVNVSLLPALDWMRFCSRFSDGMLNNAGRPRRWGNKTADPWPWASAERHQSKKREQHRKCSKSFLIGLSAINAESFHIIGNKQKHADARHS